MRSSCPPSYRAADAEQAGSGRRPSLVPGGAPLDEDGGPAGECGAAHRTGGDQRNDVDIGQFSHVGSVYRFARYSFSHSASESIHGSASASLMINLATSLPSLSSTTMQ